MAITQEEADRIELAFIDAFDLPTDEEQAKPAFKAWSQLYALMERENNYSNNLGIKTIDWQIGNWACDTTMVLHNAKEHEKCIRVNEQILKIYWYDDESTSNFHENALRDIADEYYYMGNTKKAYELYENYLKEDPLWGWGWVGYYRILEENNDPRYEVVLHSLYKKLTNGTEFRDQEDLLMDLSEVFQQRREEEQAAYCLDKMKRTDKDLSAYDETLSRLIDTVERISLPIVESKKIYPNDPCPCGSGKKYKKCCKKS